MSGSCHRFIVTACGQGTLGMVRTILLGELNLKRGDQRGGGTWNTWGGRMESLGGGGHGSPMGKAIPKLCSRWRHSHQTPREWCPWKVCNDPPAVAASGSALPPGHKGDLKFPGYVLSCSQDSAVRPCCLLLFFQALPFDG